MLHSVFVIIFVFQTLSGISIPISYIRTCHLRIWNLGPQFRTIN